MKKPQKTRKELKIAGACLSVVMGGTAGLHAQTDRLAQLEKENQTMHQRLDMLEELAQKEGLLPSGKPAPKLVHAMSDLTLSGFVTASFFHDTSNPPGDISPGYLWNRHNDSFSLNKVKLTLASKPVEASGEEFQAGFRTSLIFGDDAPWVNSDSGTTGFDVLREAYVEANIPIGTGLNVRMGELISLLNYESGDGGAANDNFSQGLQWFYTGNGPAAGIQLGYTLSSKVDVKVRVQNGLYAGPVDNNTQKTFMGSIGFKPNDTMWFSFIGFAGREASTLSVWGGSVLGGWNATKKLNVGMELDFFNFTTGVNTGNENDAPVWSTGLWTAYWFTPKVGLAFRGEFVSDKDGADLSGDPLGFAPNTGQDVGSLTLTLNYKPIPSLKIQPEVRYDHTSLANAFGKSDHRFLIGAGVSYLF
jgi:hypothetical protein